MLIFCFSSRRFDFCLMNISNQLVFISHASPTEQFVEKSSCNQPPLTDLSSLDAHGDFSGSTPAACTEPLIPTNPGIPSEEMAKISCSLETKELWDKFHELGTEMIITKSGR